MSKVWLQKLPMAIASAASAFALARTVGTAVHQSRVAAVGNFDDDLFDDIIIGNRLFLGDPEGRRRKLSADFSWTAGIPIGSRNFAQVYAGTSTANIQTTSLPSTTTVRWKSS